MRSATLLLGVAFLDELISGLAPTGSPETGLAVRWLAVAVFAVPSVAGLVEAPLLVRAEKAPRRWLVGSLVVMALASFLGALSTGWMLAVCLALFAPASGISCALAESELSLRETSRREQALARWTLAGAVGDLAAVVLLSAVSLGPFGLRAAFAVCGVLALLEALGVSRVPLALAAPPLQPDGGSEASARIWPIPARLLAWLLGLTLCSLLDEVVIAFGALHLAEGLGAGVHARSWVLGSWMAGGFLGLAAADRLLRRVRPLRLLSWIAIASTALYLAWLGADSIAASAVLAFLAGAAAAPLYPIAKAQAYRALPDRPAVVNALGSLLSPLEWAVFPIAVGLLADGVGLPIAMASLAAQPVVLFLLAVLEIARRRSSKRLPHVDRLR